MDTPPVNLPENTKTCPHCQKEIPTRATRCPFCQADLRNWVIRHPFLFALLVVFGLGIIGSVIGAANQPPTSPSENATGATTQPTDSIPTAAVSAATIPVVTSTPAPVASTASWHVEYTYSNNTSIQTPPFAMHGGEWKVTYTCDAESGYFSGEIESASDGSYATQIANGPSCPVTQTSYAYGQTAGEYYLDMTSDGPSYSVTVSDYY